MVGNLFENIAGEAIFINGGRDHVVLNNILINVDSQWKFTAIVPPNPEAVLTNLMKSLDAVPYQNDLWKNAYPKLYNMLNEEPGVPKNNIIRNNLYVKSGKPDIHLEFMQTMDMRDNFETLKPGFIDAQNGNYLLKDDSEVFKKIPTFRQLPITRMGTYFDRTVQRVKGAVVLAVGSPMSMCGGEQRYIDTENTGVVPKIVDGASYVPLRFIAEALGAEVKFDDKTGKISIIGSDISLEFTIDEKVAMKNGQSVEMNNTAFSEDGRTFVPLREISGLFDKSVFWDERGLIAISEREDLFNPDSDETIIDYLYQSISAY